MDPIHELYHKHPNINFITEQYDGEPLDTVLAPTGFSQNISSLIINGASDQERQGNITITKQIEFNGIVDTNDSAVMNTVRFAIVQNLASDTIGSKLKWDDVFDGPDYAFGLRRIRQCENTRVLWDSGPICMAGSQTNAVQGLTLIVGNTSTPPVNMNTPLQSSVTGVAIDTSTGAGFFNGNIVNSVPLQITGGPTTASWTAIQTPGTGDSTIAWTGPPSTTTIANGTLFTNVPAVTTNVALSNTTGQNNNSVTTTSRVFVKACFNCHLRTTYDTNSLQVWPKLGSIYLLARQDASGTTSTGTNFSGFVRMAYISANQRDKK